jgi:hypothetical protein
MNEKIDEYYDYYLKFLLKKKIKVKQIKNWDQIIYIVKNEELKAKLDEKKYWSFVTIPRTVPSDEWYFVEDIVHFLNIYWKSKEKLIEEAYEDEIRN